MKVILLEGDELYQKLMCDIKVLIRDAMKEISKEKEKEWVSTTEAKVILGVKSKSKMQE
jgi:peptidyl-tRNA hydrolase